MPRIRLTALCVLTLFTVATLPAEAAKRSQCQRLSGKDRAPARDVKLVKRPSSARPLRDGTPAARLVGCVLPRGRLYTVAVRRGTENDLADEYSFAVQQVVGPVVVLYQGGSDGGYQAVDSMLVWNLASGRSYTIASSCFGKDIPCSGGDTFSARAVFVTPEGRAVAALERYRPGATGPAPIVIAAFAPDGRRTDLDSGAQGDLPPRSLALAGNIASWTHSGRPLSSDVSLVSPGWYEPSRPIAPSTRSP